METNLLTIPSLCDGVPKETATVVQLFATRTLERVDEMPRNCKLFLSLRYIRIMLIIQTLSISNHLTGLRYWRHGLCGCDDLTFLLSARAKRGLVAYGCYACRLSQLRL